MFSSTFLRDAAERAISTFAQTLLALVGTDATDILSVGFGDALKASVIAAGLSVLKALAVSRFGKATTDGGAL